MPIGMLLADTLSERRWQRRALDWMSSTGEKVEHAGERIRRAVEQDLRKGRDSSAPNVPDLGSRAAERARQRDSAQTEHAVLNSISRDELQAVYGIGPVIADRIIRGRPYRHDREVVERGILSDSVFAQLRRQVLTRHRRQA
jgi:DNA uptake protein ComE-like DNA-binding protein